jgi:hypothetical protein
MANRIDFAVSATPIKSTTFGVDYAASDVTDLSSQAHDYIEPNIGKTLGGNGSISGIAATVVGYGGTTDGVADYLTTSSQVITLATSAVQDMIFIKNPGLKSDGTEFTGTITVKMQLTSGGADQGEFCTLGKGMAIVLPTVPTGKTFTFTASGSDEVKIEYATIT